jgi:hypothetical protein
MVRKKPTTPSAFAHGRRLHTVDRRRITDMELESIEQQELTASERTVLAEDRKRWQRMGAGSHLDEWLSFGPGLMIRRHLAMKLAHVNKPEGRGYAQ